MPANKMSRLRSMSRSWSEAQFENRSWSGPRFGSVSGLYSWYISVSGRWSSSGSKHASVSGSVATQQ